MMHYMKRCIHCRTVYTYQASGNGCHHELNDDNYCPVCKAAIVAALKKIPRKFEKSFEITDEVTYEYLKKIRDEQDAKNGGLCSRRVYCSTFNLKTGEGEVNDAFDVDKKEYLVQYWKSEPGSMRIQVAREKNLITGEIGDYWKDYTNPF